MTGGTWTAGSRGRSWNAGRLWDGSGEPEDVARVALFLASSDSDFVTGAGIVVDGGLTLRAM